MKNILLALCGLLAIGKLFLFYFCISTVFAVYIVKYVASVVIYRHFQYIFL